MEEYDPRIGIMNLESLQKSYEVIVPNIGEEIKV